MKTKTITENIGHLQLTLTIDIIDGEDMDTKVEVNGAYLCTIAGNERTEFIAGLCDVVERHSI